MINESVENLVAAIKQGDAISTEQAFAAAMADKLGSLIDAKRQEVASTMFAQPEVTSAEEEVESTEE